MPVGFWRTVRVLLGAARQRSIGRRRRSRELMAQRSGRSSATDWSFFGTAMTVFFMTAVHVGAAFILLMAVDAAQSVATEVRGKIVVDGSFYQAVRSSEAGRAPSPPYHSEAVNLARRNGGSSSVIEQQLRDAVQKHGSADLVPTRRAAPGVKALALTGPVPMMVGSFILLWWGVMLVFQGEGLELDVQRRRYPLWEWIFSHPVPPRAVFFAEILSPIAANPAYWTSPLFAGVVYGSVYGPVLGVFAIFLVGVPVTIAAACLGKALETGVILRFSSRTRGAMLGFMSWIGYSAFMFLFVAAAVLPRFIHSAGRSLSALAVVPWPFLRLFLGGPWPGRPGFSFLTGVLTCWLASLVAIACGVWFTVWGAQRGLAGATGDNAPARARSGASIRFGREPLYRKEFLWFVRDRSALVQTILIPLPSRDFRCSTCGAFSAKRTGRGTISAAPLSCSVLIFFGSSAPNRWRLRGRLFGSRLAGRGALKACSRRKRGSGP